MNAAPESDLTLSARFLFPIDQPPIANGCLTIRSGRVLTIDAQGTRSVDIDLGNAAILPGLVNAHTHLDLSGLRGQTPLSTDFVAWLRQVIGQRHVQTPEQVRSHIQAGLAECLDAGTTLIGDISAGGQSWDILANALGKSVVFY